MIIDKLNLQTYNKIYRDGKLVHKYPCLHTIRCEKRYFNSDPGKMLDYGPGKILDYGCGTGKEARYFSEQGYEVHALEVSPLALKYLSNINSYLLTTDKLPFPDEFFDYIHANQVLHYVSSERGIKALIKEWYRVMKPRGKFMVSTLGPQSTYGKGKEIRKNVFRVEYKTYEMDYPLKHNLYVMQKKDIKRLFKPFKIDEIGWWTNHYCGNDGFHWQILGRK